MRDPDQEEQGTTAAAKAQSLVTLGRISGAYGIQGWVKVHSETGPRDNIVRYSPWYLEWHGQRATRAVSAGRLQGKTVVAKLVDCDDRAAAERLIGADIRVRREQLPELSRPGEFYWTDLIGLAVETADGVSLGRIARLFETGANDVIIVAGERERLIPYVWGQVVLEVDLDQAVMRVDWDPEF